MDTKSQTMDAQVIQGAGIGLRAEHYALVIEQSPQVPWFEILYDNYLMAGGMPLKHLETIAANYPLVMHSVGMSIGSTDPLNWEYLKKIKMLATRIQAPIVSDHLCWISAHKNYMHELLPLPYTNEAIKHVVTRIDQVQEFLGQQILVENVSSYLSYKQSEMTEWDFMTEVANRSGCGILLDINNIYVSASNHHFDAEEYINSIQMDHVKQFHLAGFEECDHYLLDNHGSQVSPEVWALYQFAVQRFGNVPTLIEWDTDIPAFSVLENEAEKAQKILDEYAHEVIAA